VAQRADCQLQKVEPSVCMCCLALSPLGTGSAAAGLAWAGLQRRSCSCCARCTSSCAVGCACRVAHVQQVHARDLHTPRELTRSEFVRCNTQATASLAVSHRSAFGTAEAVQCQVLQWTAVFLSLVVMAHGPSTLWCVVEAFAWLVDGKWLAHESSCCGSVVHTCTDKNSNDTGCRKASTVSDQPRTVQLAFCSAIFYLRHCCWYAGLP
jgi:hypothetical protein